MKYDQVLEREIRIATYCSFGQKLSGFDIAFTEDRFLVVTGFKQANGKYVIVVSAELEVSEFKSMCHEEKVRFIKKQSASALELYPEPSSNKWSCLAWWLIGWLLKVFWKAGGYYMGCPHCRHHFNVMQSPWFELQAIGPIPKARSKRAFFWVGVQTCPRCHWKWEMRDRSTNI